MKIQVSAILLPLLLASCVSNPPADDQDLGYNGKKQRVFGYSSTEEAIAALKQKPSAEFRTERGWTVISIKDEHTGWSFPPPDHPAYPSAIKREVVEKDGTVYLETRVSCGASKSACDALVRDFIQLNEKVREQVNAR